MPNPYKRLYSTSGTVLAREGRTAADAATWTPDNLGAGDTFNDTVFDGEEWESVQVTPIFTDGAGSVVDGTSANITPLVLVSDPRAANGRVWRELTATGVITDDELTAVAVQGHRMGFRITAVTLGSATDVGVAVTGGVLRKPRV